MKNMHKMMIVLISLMLVASWSFGQSEMSPKLKDQLEEQKKPQQSLQELQELKGMELAPTSLKQLQQANPERDVTQAYWPSEISINAKSTPIPSDELFDLQFEFPVGIGGGEAGIETDGDYIYTSMWNGGGEFQKYEIDGTWLETFTVAGSAGCRDIAYNGTYFYGGAASTTVFEMDFNSATMISTFSAPTDCRAIAYNEDDDAFYANNWGSDITKFDMAGANLGSFPVGPTGDSYYGFAYQSSALCGDGPFLWGHAQVGATQNELVQISLPDGAETGVYFDVGSVAAVGTGIAGGLAIHEGLVSGFHTILGTSQNVNIWGLELCVSGPLPDNDLGVQAISAPNTGVNLTATEEVMVMVKNYGNNAQSIFDVSFTLDGGTPVVESVSTTINPGESYEHTFGTTVDLSAYGSYNIEACVTLTGDENPDNDCKDKTVENLEPSLCVPLYSSGCVVGDGFTDFAVEEIENYGSGCEDNTGFTGWSEYYGLGPATLFPGVAHTFTMGTGYGGQFVDIWIDFNDDLELTEDEKIIDDFELVDAGVLYEVDITIPVNALPGQHVMRARAKWLSGINDPCEEYSYGEAEDYYVFVGTPEYGNLEGVVTENTGGAPIEDAMISVNNGLYTAMSGPDGSYSITDVFIGDWDAVCTKDGYNPQTATVSITTGNTTVQDFAMTAPTMDITPTSIDITIDPNTQTTEFIDIANNGDGPLSWGASLEMLTDNTKDMFDVLLDVPVGVGGGEAGIETDGMNIYTSMWNGGGEFQQYDMDGNWLGTVTVAGSAGCRDIAYNGTYFYGGAASTTVFEMDIANGTMISTFTAPTDCRAIAYNEVDDAFYANNWGSDITKFDMAGANLGSFPVGPVGDSYYGFAFDNYSVPGTPYLWGYAQVGATQNELVQISLPDGVEMMTFDVGSVVGVGTGIAGGLAIDDNIEAGLWAILGTSQNVNLWALELAPAGPVWIQIDPTSGDVDPGNADQMAVNFDATDIVAGTVKTAEITFMSDPDVGMVTVPVSMTVGALQFGFVEGNVVLDGIAPYNFEDVTNVLVEAGPYSAYPDANGDYSITVYPGTYDVTATLYGYTQQVSAGVVVDEGVTVSGIDFTMPCIYGRVMGTITDEDTGEPLENAVVTIEGTEFEYITGADGMYEIFVEAGTYDITADHPNHVAETETDVVINVQADTQLDFQLILGLLSAYPAAEDYWTGTTDGSTKTEVSYVKAYGGGEQGWMKFDISIIPTGAIINSIVFHGYVTNTNWPYWSITPMPIDPVTASAADIYNTAAAGSGTDLAYSYNNESSSFGPGWKEYLLENGANEDLGNATQQGWFAVGIYERDGTATYFLEFDGWQETNVPYLEIDFFIPAFGVLNGTVTDATTGNPIEDANVVAVGPYSTYDMMTGADGTYEVDPCQVGTYTITCSAPGYNTIVVEDVEVTEGNVTTQDFELTAPEFTVDPLEIFVTLEPNAMTTETVTIENPGAGTVSWSANLDIQGDGNGDDLFDVLLDVPVGVGGGEAGIETNGNFIYTSMWNGGGEFQRYAMDGTWIETINVAGSAGCRDIAYNGTYFYGGAASTTVFEMDLDNAAMISTFTAPTDCRAIAYNEVDDAFYANNWGSDITKFDMAGANLGSFPVGPVGDSYYGFAFDNYSGGTFLWGYAQVGATQNELVQIELPSGVETGLTQDVGALVAVGTGIAGGLAIDDQIEAGLWAILGTSQNVNIWALELTTADNWIMIEPNSGTLDPGANETMDVMFDATDLLPGIYTADINFSTSPDVGSPTVAVELTVEGLIPAINLTGEYSCTDVNLSWEMPAGGDPDSWNVYRDGELIGNATEMNHSDVMVDPEVEYSYTVTAVYGGEESMPTAPMLMTVPIPDDLEALNTDAVDMGNGTVMFTWEEPAACLAPDEYEVFRDGESIGTTTELEYEDTGLEGGFYEYYVVAHYYFGESGQSTPAYVLVIVGVDELGASQFEIYPNPATDYVTVKSDFHITSVEMLNNAGQVVYTEDVEAAQFNVNVSQYERGIYYLKLTTDEGTVLRKIAIR